MRRLGPLFFAFGGQPTSTKKNKLHFYWRSRLKAWHGQFRSIASLSSPILTLALMGGLIKADRKMCVVVQHHLAKGRRAAPCWIPPAHRRVQAVSHYASGQPCGRCIASRSERSCSPNTPMTKGDFSSPLRTPSMKILER